MTPPGRIPSDTTQAQIDALGDRMDKGFTELKEMLYRFDERIREIDRLQASSQPVLISRLDAAWRRIDSHSVEIDKYREDLVTLTHSLNQLENIFKWMLGIFTSVIITLLIAFFTGKIDIVIR